MSINLPPPSCTCETAQQVRSAARAPVDLSRRQLLGGLAGLGSLASLLPIAARDAIAAGEMGKPEKTAVIVGMIPNMCALPMVIAKQTGLFEKYGVTSVTFVQTGAQQLITIQLASGAFDLSQQYMPAPLLPSLTARPGDDIPVVAAILGQNGCSLVLALKHKDNRDPKNWRTFRFGVPFLQSHHALLLRYFLAEHGLDPDIHVSFRAVPPGQFVSQLKTGIIDGYLASEPNGQQAVYEDAGYIHTLSEAIWPGHPCCALTAQASWIKRYPNTALAFLRAIVEAADTLSDKSKVAEFVRYLAMPEYLNQQEVVIEPVLSGQYADGLGDQKSAPNRTAYDPYPYPSSAIWMLTQLKRWGFVRDDIKYAEVAHRVVLDGQLGDVVSSLRLHARPAARTEVIMGRPFDPARPQDYISGFRIRR